MLTTAGHLLSGTWGHENWGLNPQEIMKRRYLCLFSPVVCILQALKVVDSAFLPWGDPTFLPLWGSRLPHLNATMDFIANRQAKNNKSYHSTVAQPEIFPLANTILSLYQYYGGNYIVKRCFWLTWMRISKISRKYWAVMSVESFENGLFCQKQAKKDQNSTKWPFCRCSTGITTQYFLLIFDMVIQVNQKHLLAPFPASTYFFFHELKMAIRTKTSSRPQLSLKLAHTKGSVAQLHNIKEYTTIFRLQ